MRSAIYNTCRTLLLFTEESNFYVNNIRWPTNMSDVSNDFSNDSHEHTWQNKCFLLLDSTPVTSPWDTWISILQELGVTEELQPFFALFSGTSPRSVQLKSGQNTDGRDWLSLAQTFQSQSGICQKDGDLERP